MSTISTNKIAAIARCPTCKRAGAWSSDNPWRPFCSERCRLIDLGAWLSEEHRIPGEPATDLDLSAADDDAQRAASRKRD
ncbi:MAG: DNA gyrase inhibitor YacG [Steroidobacteraceae bacterium]